MNTQSTNLNTQKKTLGPTGLYELVLQMVAVHGKTSNVQPKCQGPLQLLCALLSFSHDQHHETDTAKRKAEWTGRLELMLLISLFSLYVSSSLYTRLLKLTISQVLPTMLTRNRLSFKLSQTLCDSFPFFRQQMFSLVFHYFCYVFLSRPHA